MIDQTEIHRKANSSSLKDRIEAIDALREAFSQIPDKDQNWKDLHRLTQDENGYVRWRATDALGSAFGQVPDKGLAWKDLLRLAHDDEIDVQESAANALGLVFDQVPDKDLAWLNLHSQALDKDSDVRWIAARALGLAFGQIPDKGLAWTDLHRLTLDEDSFVRGIAADALGLAFGQVPDKGLAWADLHRLTLDKNTDVRWIAADALGLAFGQVPDKGLAWVDLHRLTQDEYPDVRISAADAQGKAFGQIPDKDQAWKDLHRLTQDENISVRQNAANALGAVFGLVPDKDQAWKDLYRLTQDEESDVRMYAYHSLGRISVLRAIEVKADDRAALKRELDAAVKCFEKSSQESKYSPASFCYPFYRTYYAIAIQGAEGDEVKKYLAEAKNAVRGSESKDELLKAVENLAHALEESQRLKERSLREISSELNTYRWYCEKAAGHMSAAEDKAPGAVKLMRKCNPLLEEHIQLAISEIQKSASKICQLTHGSGTEYEAPGAEIQQAAKYLDSDDISLIQKSSAKIVRQLKKFCRLLPAEDKEEVCDIVEGIEQEPEFPEKLNKIATALRSLSPVLEDKSPLVDVVILTVLQEEYDCICNRLAEPGLPPGLDATPNLYAWQSGNVFCQNFQSDYRIAVGMIGRPGTTEGALAAREAVQLWRPRYILFSGIAGGLPDPKDDDALPGLGDVVIADVIYGYEYGKIDKKFLLRTNWTYRTDKALRNGAIAYSRSDCWRKRIKAKSPAECNPKVIGGEIASGNKVIDNPSNSFFKQVLKMWPKIIAVEMEGVGVAGAIEQDQSLGIPTGFMMIRGISDLPRAEGKDRGTKERDAWKIYASDVAAAFIIGWISDGLPVRPSASSIQ